MSCSAVHPSPRAPNPSSVGIPIAGGEVRITARAGQFFAYRHAQRTRQPANWSKVRIIRIITLHRPVRQMPPFTDRRMPLITGVRSLINATSRSHFRLVGKTHIHRKFGGAGAIIFCAVPPEIKFTGHRLPLSRRIPRDNPQNLVGASWIGVDPFFGFFAE